MSALLLKMDIARYFPVAAAHVDPQMPPERLSAQMTLEFAAKPSLPSITADRAREAGRNSAVNRAHSKDMPLPRGEWVESGCAGSLSRTRLSLEPISDVRSTPESGRHRSRKQCRLSANNGHRTALFASK
jgi:hypothetical protein